MAVVWSMDDGLVDRLKKTESRIIMTLEEIYKEIKDLMGVYGENCPVKSFAQLHNVSQIPHIWYDEDEDAVLIS